MVDRELKIALDLLEEFMPDYDLGYYKGERFLIVPCGWSGVEALGKKARELLDIVIENLGDDEVFSIAIRPLVDHEDNWGFYDEYIRCYGCSNIINIHYDYYWQTECEIFCEECVNGELSEEYLEYLVNNHTNLNTMLSEDYLVGKGFTKLWDKWRNGWYGWKDIPLEVMGKLREEYEQVIFHMEYSNPFEVCWSAYVKGVTNEEK